MFTSVRYLVVSQKLNKKNTKTKTKQHTTNENKQSKNRILSPPQKKYHK